MSDVFYPVIGRASLALDYLRPVVAALRGKPRIPGPTAGLDRTGLLVEEARALPVLHDDADVLLVDYGSLAHAFWRAQELSLFRARMPLLERPILDFGAGDGSFASVLFQRIEYGVDNDPDALAIATRYGLYDSLVQSGAGSIPLPDASVKSVIANSVFEHLAEPDAMLRDIRRVLAPGGTLLCTVPTAAFADHLTKYFGAAESRRINEEYFHRNLYRVGEWRRRIEAAGFEISEAREYQPDWFTWWYRMFRLAGDRGLAHFVPDLRGRIWRRWGRDIVAMVRRSICEPVAGGANLCIVARAI